MNGVWNTIGTILATGVAMVLGYWAQHYWAGKREIREAKRKYRESMVTPVKEALTKLHAGLRSLSLVDDIIREAKGKGISLDPETERNLELLKEHLQRCEAGSQWEVSTELVPLATAITDEEVREYVEKAFLRFGLGKQIREVLKITDEDMEKILNLAYQKLEDYVALAD